MRSIRNSQRRVGEKGAEPAFKRFSSSLWEDQERRRRMRGMLQFLRDDLQAMRRYFRDARAEIAEKNLRLMGLNPKFCVNSQQGENRSEFNVCGSGSIRLPPCAQYNAGGDGCQGRRQGRRSSERRAAARRPLTSGPGGVIRACVRQSRWTTARGSRSSPAAVPSTFS